MRPAGPLAQGGSTEGSVSCANNSRPSLSTLTVASAPTAPSNGTTSTMNTRNVGKGKRQASLELDPPAAARSSQYAPGHRSAALYVGSLASSA
jgi:NAD(P)H-dependent FMN reductase